VLRLPRFQFVAPASLAQASAILGQPTAMAVAGGTDVYPKMKRRQFTPETLVSLRNVVDGEIRNGTPHTHDASRRGLRIGAGATLTAVAEHPLVRERYPALALAAGVISTPQLRNMGTLGGNLCLDTRCNWYDQSLFWRTAEGYCMKTHPAVVCRVATSSPRCLAVASADTVPALIVLGAQVAVANAAGERELDLVDLYREDGIRYLTLATDDIVTEVRLPDASGWRSTYLKLRERGAFDFPICGVAAAVRFQDDVCADARVAITALGSSPQLVSQAREALVGTRLEDAAVERAADAVYAAARPLDNTSGTIAERKRASRVFAARALRALRHA
jgi:4-hydroxybenzoyl-CoA reductase subunit beta